MAGIEAGVFPNYPKPPVPAPSGVPVLRSRRAWAWPSCAPARPQAGRPGPGPVRRPGRARGSGRARTRRRPRWLRRRCRWATRSARPADRRRPRHDAVRRGRRRARARPRPWSSRIAGAGHDGTAELRSIAAITFTEKAAAELRDRIRRGSRRQAEARPAATAGALSPAALDQLDGAAIGTLHAFAQRLLSEHPVEAGLPPRVEVLDEVSSGVAFDQRWVGVPRPAPGRPGPGADPPAAVRRRRPPRGAAVRWRWPSTTTGTWSRSGSRRRRPIRRRWHELFLAPAAAIERGLRRAVPLHRRPTSCATGSTSIADWLAELRRDRATSSTCSRRSAPNAVAEAARASR